MLQELAKFVSTQTKDLGNELAQAEAANVIWWSKLCEQSATSMYNVQILLGTVEQIGKILEEKT